ncbi:MAG: lipoyl(octanoyl) transferase LipB [Dissulfuribacterales bacterium]
MISQTEWFITKLGPVRYQEAHKLQTDIIEARHYGSLDKDIVLMLEHPPVFTLGRRGGRQNITVDENVLRSQGIDVVSIERGGDITFHGPGQQVVYLLVDLRARGMDIPDFVRSLEEVMIRTAKDQKIDALRDVRNPGAWVQGNKLGSIGIAIRHGITFHGFALNVNIDLTPFQWIHPCGLKGVSMTSLAARKKCEIDMGAVQKSVEKHLQSVFNIQLKLVSREELGRLANFHAPAINE